jgi:hypothetical protein
MAAALVGAVADSADALRVLEPGELIESVDTGIAGRRTAARMTSETRLSTKSLGLRNEEGERNLFMASP